MPSTHDFLQKQQITPSCHLNQLILRKIHKINKSKTSYQIKKHDELLSKSKKQSTAYLGGWNCRSIGHLATDAAKKLKFGSSPSLLGDFL